MALVYRNIPIDSNNKPTHIIPFLPIKSESFPIKNREITRKKDATEKIIPISVAEKLRAIR
jgi:hypothetical protein